MMTAPVADPDPFVDAQGRDTAHPVDQQRIARLQAEGSPDMMDHDRPSRRAAPPGHVRSPWSCAAPCDGLYCRLSQVRARHCALIDQSRLVPHQYNMSAHINGRRQTQTARITDQLMKPSASRQFPSHRLPSGNDGQQPSRTCRRPAGPFRRSCGRYGRWLRLRPRDRESTSE